MDSFYRIFFYPIIFILSLFLANHITLCLGFCVDMVSNLDPVSIIFALSLTKLAKCLGDTAINIYRNHDYFCIGSDLINQRRGTFLHGCMHCSK